MTKEEFISLIGQDFVIDYPFGRELQRWSMKNFYVDENGELRRKDNGEPIDWIEIYENWNGPDEYRIDVL